MTQVIGFAGKKQSGKDTCCKFLSALTLVSYRALEDFRFDKYKTGGIFPLSDDKFIGPQIELNKVAPQIIKIYSFAGYLKEICSTLFSLDINILNGSNEDKNITTHLVWDNMPGICTSKEVFNSLYKFLKKKEELYPYINNTLKIQYHPPGQMTHREVLQYVGTEIFREMYSSCWVDALINNIKKDNPIFALISDVRFKNEIQAIKRNNGIVCKLNRDIQGGKDSHTSENDFLSYTDWDIEIDNQEGDLSILTQNLVREMIKNKMLPPIR